MNVLFKTAIVVTIISMIMSSPAIAASGKDEMIELKKEIQTLKEGLNSVTNDLAEIKKLLRSDARTSPALPKHLKKKPFEPRDVVITGAAVMGDANAKVTLIEYSDYQCLYCARHFRQTMPKIIRHYINEGKVKFVMREMPIPNLNLQANAASQAALCSGSQGRYWEMHDILFNRQRKMSDHNIRAYASEIGLDTGKFNDCFEQNKYAEQIEKDVAEAKKMGVTGTPSFVFGLTDTADPNKIKVTKFMHGARNYDSFAKEIDELLANSDEVKAEDRP